MLRLVLLLSLFAVTSSMVVWPELTSEDGHMSRPRPKSWSEKNLGQWCRNFTIHEHKQCPEASAFHEYRCCGLHNTECCFAIQQWVFIICAISTMTTTCIFVFYILLKMNLICMEQVYPPKTIYLAGK